MGPWLRIMGVSSVPVEPEHLANIFALVVAWGGTIFLFQQALMVIIPGLCEPYSLGSVLSQLLALYLAINLVGFYAKALIHADRTTVNPGKLVYINPLPEAKSGYDGDESTFDRVRKENKNNRARSSIQPAPIQARAYHQWSFCKLCQAYTYKKDHHCFFFARCIGVHNQRFFFGYCTQLVFAACINVTYALAYMRSPSGLDMDWQDIYISTLPPLLWAELYFNDRRFPNDVIRVAFIVTFCVVVILFASYFIITQIHNISSGLTPWEMKIMAPSDKAARGVARVHDGFFAWMFYLCSSSKLKDDSAPNDGPALHTHSNSNKGCCSRRLCNDAVILRNIRIVLGPRWWYAWLCVFIDPLVTFDKQGMPDGLTQVDKSVSLV